jgi:VCBS repeat-containing protein
MDTAVAAGAQGIGFALPASELRQALASFQKNGRIVRPYLGVRYVPITPTVQAQRHLSVSEGVLVTSDDPQNAPAVLPGSPAAKAGIQSGDIILQADGQKLSADVSLQHLVLAKNPGDTMTLVLLHAGTQKTVTVTLQERTSP